MSSETQKAIKAVSLFIQLTQRKELRWEKLRTKNALLHAIHPEYPTYIADFKGDKLRISHATFGGMLSEPAPPAVPNLLPRSHFRLDVLGSGGNVKHTFPAVGVIDELYSEVKNQSSEFEDYLDSILGED